MAKVILGSQRFYSVFTSPRMLTTTLTQNEAAVWLGAAFRAGHTWTAVANGSTLYAQFIAPPVESGIIISLIERLVKTSNGGMDVNIYKNPIGVTGAVNMSSANLRRKNPLAKTLIAQYATGRTSPGSFELHDFVPGAGAQPQARIGASADGGFMILLDPGETIFYELTNTSGATLERVRIQWDWFEISSDFVNI